VVARQHEIVAQLRPPAQKLERTGARLYLGEARFLDAHTLRVDGRAVRGDRFIIAAGSAPVVPPLPGRELAITSDELLFLPEFPGSLLLVGGGAIGLEMAGAFSDLGAAVTVIAQEDEILPGFDPDVAGYLRAMLEARGVTFHRRARVTGLSGRSGDVIVRFTVAGTASPGRGGEAAARPTPEASLRESGHAAGRSTPEASLRESAGGLPEIPGAPSLDREARARVVCLAVGRRWDPRTLGAEGLGLETNRLGLKTSPYLGTSVPHIWAAGDAAGNIQLTPAAAHEGRVAAENAVRGDRVTPDLSLVPQTIFTTPEIARVGLTHREAHQRGIACHVTTHDTTGASNSVVTGEHGGYLKLVFAPGSERILGVQLVAYAAAELIQIAALAMRTGATAGLVSSQLSIHPSEAERFIKVAAHEYHEVCEL
jgi:pyruvate/2-oxoglutarate dehydrogenase complex dihydrolipoamide dehydrogenase (E3) component